MSEPPRGRLSEGLYARVITSALALDLKQLEPGQSASIEPLDPADSHVALARHLADEVQRTLDAVRGDEKPQTQVAIVNRLLEELRALSNGESETQIEPPGAELLSIHRAAPRERPRRHSLLAPCSHATAQSRT